MESDGEDYEEQEEYEDEEYDEDAGFDEDAEEDSQMDDVDLRSSREIKTRTTVMYVLALELPMCLRQVFTPFHY